MSEKSNIPSFIVEKSKKLRSKNNLTGEVWVICQYVRTLDMYTLAGFITEDEALRQRQDVCNQIQDGNMGVQELKTKVDVMLNKLTQADKYLDSGDEFSLITSENKDEYLIPKIGRILSM